MLCGENGRYSPPVVMFGEEAQPGQVSHAPLWYQFMFYNPPCPGPDHRAGHHAPHPVAAALQLHPRHGPQPRAQDDRRHQVGGVRWDVNFQIMWRELKQNQVLGQSLTCIIQSWIETRLPHSLLVQISKSRLANLGFPLNDPKLKQFVQTTQSFVLNWVQW